MLIEGVNIKPLGEATRGRNASARSPSRARCQRRRLGWGASVAHIKADAKDEEINRYRPLVVIAEHGAGLGTLKERAEWETKVRMGRGKRGHVDVVGWRTGTDGQEGPLWTPNTLVYIDSPRLKLDRDMLIVGCDYQMDDKKGRVTKLTFCRPEAFEVIAGIKRGKLGKKINHRTQHEKHKRTGRNWNSSFDLDAPALEGN
jgi:prophage tail gpP-like protein